MGEGMLEELPEYVPSQGNLQQRRWFRSAGLGMFIHWGVYSVLGRGEWVLNNERMRMEQYRQLPSHFNPSNFNATEWVLLAKSAGMSYITFTSKHHDGFCMWHSKQTRWNIVDATSYGQDVLRQLADACREHGLKLFVYYSPLDWSHPDYFPRGFTGTETGRPDSGNWSDYLAYMHRQLEEILSEYGEIAGIWLDGWWDKPSHETWRTEETYKLIHRLQSQALIGNNHHRSPYWGEDMQIFEKDAPGENTQGYAHSSLQVDSSLPLETCDTLHGNGAWGYTSDHTPKSMEQIVRMLVRSAGFDANLLLNVGPMPTGEIQPEFQQSFQLLGAWLGQHGESVVGTRGGPSPPAPWGVTTRREGVVYVHVLEWARGADGENLSAMRIALPRLKFESIQSAEVVSCQLPLCQQEATDVRFFKDAEGITEMEVQESVRDEYDTIIKVKVQDSAQGAKTEL